MVHIGGFGVREMFEAHNDARSLVRAYPQSILESHLCCRGWHTITIENLKLTVMDMEWVHHHGVIGDFPDFGITGKPPIS